MKKIISFSLWGDLPTYNIGAIKNAILAKKYYSSFECWFYIHEESVPIETINQLKGFENCKIILKTGDLSIVKPMMWRFEAIDDPDVEIMMSRDTDTRILQREIVAVNEWLNSDKVFHIMRDHPHHTFCILGGMFGTRKIAQIQNWKKCIDNVNQVGMRDYDQDFLKTHIYPIIKNNSMIHASFNNNEIHAQMFPIDYCSELKFVGEYVYHDDSRSPEHILILKQNLQIKVA